MNHKISLRPIPILVTALFSGTVSAGAFQLMEQNASGLGNAYAGTAAVAEDASTIFFNPAGLTYLPATRQVSVSAAAISPSATFSNSASRSGAGITGGAARDYAYTGLGGDAGNMAVVPSVYFAMPLTSRLSFGLGINAPFGLKTEYEDNWIGRFQGLKSELKTLNLNPTLAFKLSDPVSIGFGLDYQRIDATLTKAVNYQAVIASTPAASGGGAGTANASGYAEGRQELTGNDSGWGFNLGMMFNLSDVTRLGLAYRSSISYKLTGTQTVTHPTTASAAGNAIINGNPNTLNQAIAVDLKIPDTFTASLMHRVNDKWDLLADLSYTGWSSIQEIRIRFTSPGTSDDVTQWKLKDTLRVALGATYRYRDDLKFRFGLAHDQSPVPDQYRTVRLPDSDRTWISFGVQYKPSRDSALDVGLTYISMKDAPINNNGEQALTALGYPRGLINGSYSGNIKILGIQFTSNF